jgi:hypothetical protein
MYQLVYASEATKAFPPASIENLLADARRNNKIRRVTGMLAFCQNQFLQVLEGNPSDVISTYDRIAADPRHQNVIVLHRGYSSVGKTFTEWSMGFHSFTAADDLPANNALGERPDFYQFDGLMALNFLLACRPKHARA